MSVAEPFTAHPSPKIVPLFRDAGRITPPLDFRPDPDAELVASVLILMEAPLANIAVSICGAGPARTVFLTIDGRAASLSPSQAMACAHCLFSEQAFAGCGEVAAQLMECAIEIDPSVAAGRRFIPLKAPPRTYDARDRIHSGRTGVVSTLALVAMLLAAYVVAGLPPLMHGLG